MAKIDLTQDIQPLTTFRNNSVKMMKQLKKSKRPMYLTVNGKPEAVVQSVEEHQRLLDLVAEANEEEAYRAAMEDVRRGRVEEAGKFFSRLRKQYGIPS